MAATLFIDGITQANFLAGWFGSHRLNDIDEFAKTRSAASMVDKVDYPGSVARLAGLLPLQDTGDEMKEREWFLSKAPAILKSRFASPKPLMRGETKQRHGIGHLHELFARGAQ
jgi:hypothetical protein